MSFYARTSPVPLKGLELFAGLDAPIKPKECRADEFLSTTAVKCNNLQSEEWENEKIREQAGKEESGLQDSLPWRFIFLGSACPDWLPGLSGTLCSAASSGSDLLQEFPVDRSRSIYGISSMPRALAPRDTISSPLSLPSSLLQVCLLSSQMKRGSETKTCCNFLCTATPAETGGVCACESSHKVILRVISAVIWGVKQMRLKEARKGMFM